MITSYVIKNNILYLYVDYNYEFSYIDLKNKLKEYIKNKKIIFNGSVVAIVIGGIVIGNIMLNKDDKKDIIIDNISYEYALPTSNKMQDLIKNGNNVNMKNAEDSIIVEKNNSDISNNYIELNDSISNSNIDNKTNNVNDIVSINTSDKIDNEENNITVNNVEVEEERNIEVDNNIYVNVYRSNGEVLRLELEEYLIGCVGAEMPAAFNIEALKAQAIIARTYALKSIKTNKILTDTESTQSYKSDNELRSLWGGNFNTYYNKIKESVEFTKGEYLSYNNDYIEAVYHSTSNGITESSVNVWGNYYPYLTNVESIYDSDSPTYIQNKFISYEELSNKLNINIDNNSEINILSKTSGNRVEYIKINDIVLKGIEFRNKLGLRSNDYDISIEDTGINFTTRGYGHGVGLSQYGANGMAKRGYNYIDILYHYYPGTSLKKI